MPSIPFFNCDNKAKKEKSMPPSLYVRLVSPYKKWGRVNVCSHCGYRAYYCDMHESAPCLECGEKVLSYTGKWHQHCWLLKDEEVFLDAKSKKNVNVNKAFNVNNFLLLLAFFATGLFTGLYIAG